MAYIQIILAALSVAKEFVSYLKSKEKCRKDRVITAKKFVAGLKKARKEGKSDEIEHIFGRTLPDDKL